MFSFQEVHWQGHPAPGGLGHSAREMLAAMLRWASDRLAASAAALVPTGSVQAPGADPQFEFYAEAGAPEGALYVDGRLVGVLRGVTRL